MHKETRLMSTKARVIHSAEKSYDDFPRVFRGEFLSRTPTRRVVLIRCEGELQPTLIRSMVASSDTMWFVYPLEGVFHPLNHFRNSKPMPQPPRVDAYLLFIKEPVAYDDSRSRLLWLRESKMCFFSALININENLPSFIMG